MIGTRVFDLHHDAAVLISIGYEHTHIDEEWEDVGDAENGPRIDGHPSFDVFTLDDGTRAHEIVVADGAIVEADYVPRYIYDSYYISMERT